MERSDDRKYVCFRRVETTGPPFCLLFTNWRIPYFACLPVLHVKGTQHFTRQVTLHLSSHIADGKFVFLLLFCFLFLFFLENSLCLKTEVYNSEVYRGIARFQRSFYGEPVKISVQHQNYWYARVESVTRVLRKTLNRFALSFWRYSKGQFLRSKIRPESEY